MKAGHRTLALSLIFVLSVILAFLTEQYGLVEQTHDRADQMRAARSQASQWFEEIGRLKEARGVSIQDGAQLDYACMLGDEFSELTTTLGSLGAKAAAANPDFAALMVRFLTDAGIDSNSTVGVIQSASFPSLAIASLAALQTLKCPAVLISSLGASMYGANQPQVTWLDMEAWLRDKGGLVYASSLVTPGAENDRGEGLMEGGLEAMTNAARRTGYTLTLPPSLEESIAEKMALLNDRRIDLLINIGGNQTGVGSCPHSVGIPNGLHERFQPCSCPDRGIIARMAERGVPFIHLLYVRDLAVRYGIDLEGEPSANNSERLYNTRTPRRAVVSASLSIIGLALVAFGWFKTGRKKPTPFRSGDGMCG